MSGRRASPGAGLRFLHSVVAADPTDECILWPYGRSCGYGETASGQAHALICEMVYGSRPSGMDAAHRCGVRLCVNPRHVRWATRSENEIDKRAHGTGLLGERNPNAVLTWDQVAAIRHRYSLGDIRQRDLGVMYGVRQNTISRIVTGVRWPS